MSYAFNGTTPNLNYAVNKLNRGHNILAGLIKAVQDAIAFINGGSGSSASNEQVEAAVQWAVSRAEPRNITYSTDPRNLKVVDAMAYDCSSFIITAFYAAGIDVAATYTGDMIAGFTAVGFEWIEGSSWESSQLQRGDILLNITHHTQMYIGDGKDVNCGSTPAKVMDHVVSYSRGGWDGILRYKG